MAILETNNNYAGNKSLVYTAYATAYSLDSSNRFWQIALEEDNPASFNQTSALAVRVLVDTVLSNSTPLDLMSFYSLLENQESDWGDFGVSSLAPATVGSSLNSQQKADLLGLLAITASSFLTELNNEITTLLG